MSEGFIVGGSKKEIWQKYKDTCRLYNHKLKKDSGESKDSPQDFHSKTYRCVLCNRIGYGYGHNPQPLAEGKCCDQCNFTKVIPKRIEDSKNATS